MQYQIDVSIVLHRPKADRESVTKVQHFHREASIIYDYGHM